MLVNGSLAIPAPGTVPASRSHGQITVEWFDAGAWVPANDSPVLVLFHGDPQVIRYTSGLGWGDGFDGFIADQANWPQWWMPIPPMPMPTMRSETGMPVQLIDAFPTYLVGEPSEEQLSDLLAAKRQVLDLRAAKRAATQRIVALVGADGPMDLEQALDRLEADLQRRPEVK